MNISFIGGGNMATALIGGLSRQAGNPHRFRVVEPVATQRDALGTRFGAHCFEIPCAEALEAEVIVFAVKPQQMREVARRCAPLLRGQLVISIAAGIRAVDLSRWLGGHQRIVRTMPNTPALIGLGITGMAMLDGGSPDDRQVAEAILGAVGSTVWVDDESKLDAVTAVSGSGPAYVFRFIEAVEQAGVALGLPAAEARQLTIATFVGAAQLAAQSDEPPSVLRERVTSKGGTTAAALGVMAAGGLGELIERALAAACARGAEMGEAFGRDD